MPKLEIDVPEQFLKHFGGPANAAKVLKMAAAMGLYRRVVVSSGPASELAGVTRLEFRELLGAWHIPAFGMDMTAEDLEGEVAAARGERVFETCEVCKVKGPSDEMMTTERDVSEACGLPAGCIDDDVRHHKTDECTKGAQEIDTVRLWWERTEGASAPSRSKADISAQLTMIESKLGRLEDSVADARARLEVCSNRLDASAVRLNAASDHRQGKHGEGPVDGCPLCE